MSQRKSPQGSPPHRSDQVSPAWETSCTVCGQLYLTRALGADCPYCRGRGNSRQDSEFTHKVVDDNDLMK